MSDRLTARRLVAAREERKRQRRIASGLELIGSLPSGVLGMVPGEANLIRSPTGRLSYSEPARQYLKPPSTEAAQKMLAAYREAYPTPEIFGLDFTDAETRILAHDEALERYRK